MVIMALKKIFAIILIIVVLVLALQFFGILGNPVTEIAKVDEKYGVNEDKLVPGTRGELERYEKELKDVQVYGEEEERIIELKMHLIGMQKAILKVSEENQKVNFNEVDCRIAGPLVMSKKAAEKALENAGDALVLSRKINSAEFSYYKEEEFDEKINAVLDAMKRRIELVEQVCG